MPFFSGKCRSNARLDGKTAIVTGCNTGIGKETAKDFYKRGARVIMACRNIDKANIAKEEIIKKCENHTEKLGEIFIVKLDLTSLKSIKEAAAHILETEPKINLLVNNAGIMLCPQGLTEDGFETHIGTNHFGPFLLTMLLLPRIIESKPARIVNVSALAHKIARIDFDDIHTQKKSYSGTTAYAQSKLANIFFSTELAKKLKDNNIEGVNVYSLHPGVIATELGRHLDTALFPGAVKFFTAFKFLLKSVESGAQTTIYCSVDEKCANETGLYYSDCVPVGTSREARNPENAKRLWELSVKSVGLEDCNPFNNNKE